LGLNSCILKLNDGQYSRNMYHIVTEVKNFCCGGGSYYVWKYWYDI